MDASQQGWQNLLSRPPTKTPALTQYDVKIHGARRATKTEGKMQHSSIPRVGHNMDGVSGQQLRSPRRWQRWLTAPVLVLLSLVPQCGQARPLSGNIAPGQPLGLLLLDYPLHILRRVCVPASALCCDTRHCTIPADQVPLTAPLIVPGSPVVPHGTDAAIQWQY